MIAGVAGGVARANVDDMVGQARRAATDVRKAVTRDPTRGTDTPGPPPASEDGPRRD